MEKKPNLQSILSTLAISSTFLLSSACTTPPKTDETHNYNNPPQQKQEKPRSSYDPRTLANQDIFCVQYNPLKDMPDPAKLFENAYLESKNERERGNIGVCGFVKEFPYEEYTQTN